MSKLMLLLLDYCDSVLYDRKGNYYMKPKNYGIFPIFLCCCYVVILLSFCFRLLRRASDSNYSCTVQTTQKELSANPPPPSTMKEEIETAATFLVKLIRNGAKPRLAEDRLSILRQHIISEMKHRYIGHWHPELPDRGSGYRCIRNNGKVDPMLLKVGRLMGLAAQFLNTMFPHEITMWVDPSVVSYRIGENGSICNLYENKYARRYSHGEGGGSTGSLSPPTIIHRQPSPPVTPPNKKICGSPPATPIKMLFQASPQVTPSPPAQALSYHQYHQLNNNNNNNSSSPSSIRSSPYQYIQHPNRNHQLALFKEANCKDVMRNNQIVPMGGLYVSS